MGEVISRAHVLLSSVDGLSKPLYHQSLLNVEAELVPTPVDDLKGDFRLFPCVLAVVVFAQRGCVIIYHPSLQCGCARGHGREAGGLLRHYMWHSKGHTKLCKRQTISGICPAHSFLPVHLLLRSSLPVLRNLSIVGPRLLTSLA